MQQVSEGHELGTRAERPCRAILLALGRAAGIAEVDGLRERRVRLGFEIAATVLVVVAFASSAAAADAATLSGHVSTSGGSDVADAQVSVLTADTGIAVATGSTGSNGTYSVEVSDPGVYDVEFAPAPGSGLSARILRDIAIDGPTSLNVVLAPASTVTFSGVIRQADGTPMQGVTIELNDANGFSNHEEQYTGADGRFSFERAPGDYVWRLRGGQHSSVALPVGFNLEGGTLTLAEDREVELTIPFVAVTVQVQDPDGNPVADAPVGLHTHHNGNPPVTVAPGITMTGANAEDYATTDAQGEAVLALFPTNNGSGTVQAPPGSGYADVTIPSQVITGPTTIAVLLGDPSNRAPTADAGADYETPSGAISFLDGSGSADPDDDPLDYSWTQTSGPSVTVNGADTALASFVAPAGPATLEFELQVCDGEPVCDADKMVVTVEAAPPSAVDDEATVDEDSGATTIDVLDNDLNPGGPLEIVSVTQPENGSVVIATDSLSLSYEPTPDYCNEPGEQGADYFTYTVTGGSEAAVTVTVTCVDDAPEAPTITATSPASPANDNAPEVQGTLGAGSPTDVRIYTSADCTGPVAASGSAAEFTGGGITVAVADDTTTPLSAIAVGESDSACSNTIPYTEDSAAPNTFIDSGPRGPTNNPSPSFAFRSPQPGVTFECRLDPAAGGTWAPCSSPKGYTNLAQGPHRFEVRAIDAAGNADPSPRVRTFRVDTTPPNTLIDSGPAGLTNNPSPSFTFHSPQPGVTFECRLDPAAGGTWAPCSSPKGYTALAQGPHRFEVRAIDAAGNADPSPPVRVFNVQP